MIKIKNVSKVFHLPSEKRQSLKEHFISIFRKNKYNSLVALDNVSLQIKRGEFVGLIGRNGSGKSTLLYLISGIYHPTSGKVSTTGNIIPFLELNAGFNGELSVKDNVYLNGAIIGLDKKQIKKKFAGIIQFAELEKFVNAKLKNLSSGMQVRLAFATAIQAKADIYLVDEALAVGDTGFQKKCFEVFERFKRQGKTIVYVSHDIGSISKFCDKVALLDDGKLIKYDKTKEVVKYYQTIEKKN